MKECDHLKFGYIRTSTEDQNLERQIYEMKKHVPKDHIFLDQSTGRNFYRRGYNRLKMKLCSGDEVFFHEMDRFGRNKEEMKKSLE